MLLATNSRSPVRTGQRFNRWVVLGEAFRVSLNGRKSRPHVVCRCECGRVSVVMVQNIKRGLSRSCGCFQEETRGIASVTHGYSRSVAPKWKRVIYRKWLSMIARCENETQDSYKYYGANGIRVCELWRNSFATFADWALANGYKPGLTIDRLDNTKNYEPSNCRWATNLQQAQNTSLCVPLTAFGETKTTSAWLLDNRTVVSRRVIKRRLRDGWNTENSLCVSLHTEHLLGRPFA